MTTGDLGWGGVMLGGLVITGIIWANAGDAVDSSSQGASVAETTYEYQEYGDYNRGYETGEYDSMDTYDGYEYYDTSDSYYGYDSSYYSDPYDEYVYNYRTGYSGSYGYNYDVSGTDEYGNYVEGNVDTSGKYGDGYIINDDGDEVYVEMEWTGYGEIEATDEDGNVYVLETE